MTVKEFMSLRKGDMVIGKEYGENAIYKVLLTSKDSLVLVNNKNPREDLIKFSEVGFISNLVIGEKEPNVQKELQIVEAKIKDAEFDYIQAKDDFRYACRGLRGLDRESIDNIIKELKVSIKETSKKLEDLRQQRNELILKL